MNTKGEGIGRSAPTGHTMAGSYTPARRNTLGERLLLLASLYMVTGSIELSMSSCFNTTDKTLTLTCPQGHMVKVTRMLQGTNEVGRCTYSPEDCIYEMRHESVPCMGRETCEINLPSGNSGLPIHTCQTHGTYMQVDYSCINSSDVVDICSENDVYDQSGYVATPFYPFNYPTSRNCTLRIITPFKHQKLTIYAIDMRLEATKEGCPDLLYLYDGHRSHTSCGLNNRKKLMGTMENHVLLRFESDPVNREKGFWLYYQASPYVNISTTPIPKTTTTTTVKTTTVTTTTREPSGTTPTRVMDQTTESSQKVAYHRHSDFSIGVVVGILVGVLLCIICVILLILYLKRRHHQMSQTMVGQNARIAAMAGTLEKPVPAQTLNNLQYPRDKIQNDNNIKVDWKLDKPKYLAPFIESNLSTGEEQLVC